MSPLPRKASSAPPTLVSSSPSTQPAETPSGAVEMGPPAALLHGNRNGRALFSTELHTRPPRTLGSPPYPPMIVRGDKVRSVVETARYFQQKYPDECQHIFPGCGHDIRDYWDEVDIYTEGADHLCDVLLFIGRDNVHCAKRWADEWSRKNPHRVFDVIGQDDISGTYDRSDPFSIVDRVFVDGEQNQFNRAFLWHAANLMRQSVIDTRMNAEATEEQENDKEASELIASIKAATKTNKKSTDEKKKQSSDKTDKSKENAEKVQKKIDKPSKEGAKLQEVENLQSKGGSRRKKGHKLQKTVKHSQESLGPQPHLAQPTQAPVKQFQQDSFQAENKEKEAEKVLRHPREVIEEPEIAKENVEKCIDEQRESVNNLGPTESSVLDAKLCRGAGPVHKSPVEQGHPTMNHDTVSGVSNETELATTTKAHSMHDVKQGPANSSQSPGGVMGDKLSPTMTPTTSGLSLHYPKTRSTSGTYQHQMVPETWAENAPQGYSSSYMHSHPGGMPAMQHGHGYVPSGYAPPYPVQQFPPNPTSMSPVHYTAQPYYGGMPANPFVPHAMPPAGQPMPPAGYIHQPFNTPGSRGSSFGEMTNSAYFSGNVPYQHQDRRQTSLRQGALYDPYNGTNPSFNEYNMGRKYSRHAYSDQASRPRKSSQVPHRSDYGVPGPSMQNFVHEKSRRLTNPIFPRVQYQDDPFVVGDQVNGCGPEWIGPKNRSVNQLFLGDLRDGVKPSEIQQAIHQQMDVLPSSVEIKNGLMSKAPHAFVNFNSSLEARSVFDTCKLSSLLLQGRSCRLLVPRRFYQKRIDYKVPSEQKQPEMKPSDRDGDGVASDSLAQTEERYHHISPTSISSKPLYSPQDARSDMVEQQVPQPSTKNMLHSDTTNTGSPETRKSEPRQLQRTESQQHNELKANVKASLSVPVRKTDGLEQPVQDLNDDEASTEAQAASMVTETMSDFGVKSATLTSPDFNILEARLSPEVQIASTSVNRKDSATTTVHNVQPSEELPHPTHAINTVQPSKQEVIFEYTDTAADPQSQSATSEGVPSASTNLSGVNLPSIPSDGSASLKAARSHSQDTKVRTEADNIVQETISVVPPVNESHDQVALEIETREPYDAVTAVSDECTIQEASTVYSEPCQSQEKQSMKPVDTPLQEIPTAKATAQTSDNAATHVAALPKPTTNVETIEPLGPIKAVTEHNTAKQENIQLSETEVAMDTSKLSSAGKGKKPGPQHTASLNPFAKPSRAQRQREKDQKKKERKKEQEEKAAKAKAAKSFSPSASKMPSTSSIAQQQLQAFSVSNEYGGGKADVKELPAGEEQEFQGTSGAGKQIEDTIVTSQLASESVTHKAKESTTETAPPASVQSRREIIPAVPNINLGAGAQPSRSQTTHTQIKTPNFPFVISPTPVSPAAEHESRSSSITLNNDSSFAMSPDATQETFHTPLQTPGLPPTLHEAGETPITAPHEPMSKSKKKRNKKKKAKAAAAVAEETSADVDAFSDIDDARVDRCFDGQMAYVDAIRKANKTPSETPNTKLNETPTHETSRDESKDVADGLEATAQEVMNMVKQSLENSSQEEVACWRQIQSYLVENPSGLGS